MDKEKFFDETIKTYQEHTGKEIYDQVTCPNCSCRYIDKEYYTREFTESLMTALYKAKTRAVEILEFGRANDTKK